MAKLDFFIDVDKRFEEIENTLSFIEQALREQIFYNISPFANKMLSPNMKESIKKALEKGQFVNVFTNINQLVEYNTPLTYLINNPQATGSVGYILNLLLTYLRYMPIYLVFNRKIIYQRRQIEAQSDSTEFVPVNQTIFGVNVSWSQNDYLYFDIWDKDTGEWVIPPINYSFSHLKNKNVEKDFNKYIPTNYHILTITPPVVIDGTNLASIHYDLTTFDMDLLHEEIKKLLKTNVSWDTQLEVETIYDFPLQIDRDWDIDGGTNIDYIYDDSPIPYFINEFDDLPYYEEAPVQPQPHTFEETW